MITMKSFALVTIITMSACSTLPAQQAQSPVPLVSNSPTPISTSYTIPLPLSTSINTPYPTPVLLSPISPQDSFVAYNQRLPSLENALNFTILPGSVKVETLDNDWYFIQLEARATNSSSQSLVLPKFLSAGWTGFHIFRFAIHFQEKEIFTRSCCVDEFQYTSTDDFISLQPGGFQNYALGFILPTSITEANGSRINLVDRSITVSVAYQNDKVGFFNELNDYQYTDINAWVGEIISEDIQIQLP